MFLFDRLQNLVSGLGTSKDKAINNAYSLQLIPPAELMAMHRSDWMARKIVDIIPDDMTRHWREWKADEAVVEEIEAVENDPLISLQAKVTEALQMARLRGGAALYLGVQSGVPEEELRLEAVGRGALRYIHVLSRDEIGYRAINRDVNSPYFGEPVSYQLSGDGATVDIHPSRIIRFIGAPILDRQVAAHDCWGDSILQVVYEAIQNAASSQAHIASLIPEAKTDVIYIPNLSQHLKDANTTQKLTERFGYANTIKSMFNMILLEGNGGSGPTAAGEAWEQKQINFSQFPELMRQYLQVAAGAADIPLTRFLGDAPSGLGANGEHSLTNYYDTIAARQRNQLTPALRRLDDILIRSATGSRDPSIHYEWAPLYSQTEKERAEIFQIYANGARTLVGTAPGQEIIPREAVSDALVNRIIEDGNLPGLEQAIEVYGSLGEQGEGDQNEEDESQDDGADIGSVEIGDGKKKKHGKGGHGGGAGAHNSHYDPNQRRNEKGEWVNEGKGERSGHGQRPAGADMPEELERHAQTRPLAGRKAEAVRTYTGYHHKTINSYLRATGPNRQKLDESDKRIIRTLDQVLDNAVFSEGTVLYRSFDAFDTPYAKGRFKVGQILVDRGFMSTSRLKAQTVPFKQRARMPVTLEIQVTPGAKALDVTAYSKYPEQQEVLFARNSLLRILSHNDDYTYVKAEYVSQKIKKDAAPSVDIDTDDYVAADDEFGDLDLNDPEFLRWLHEKANEPDPPGYEPGSRFFGSLADLEIVDESEASGEPFDFTKHPGYQQALSERREMEREEAEAAKAAGEAKDQPKG